MASIASLALLCSAIIAPTQAVNQSVRIPHENTYLLPSEFSGNINQSFVNGTTTSNFSINSLLQKANAAPFIAYDDSFLDIIGDKPQPKLIDNRTTLFAYEAGVWIPELNEVWFTSSTYQASTIPGYITVFDLLANTLHELNGTSKPIINPNERTNSMANVDPRTLEVETVINSYFGLPFNFPDDLVWTTQGNNRYLFFTDPFYGFIPYPDNFKTPQLPVGVWRWDPREEILLPVISRNEIQPNGVRVSPDMKSLYVTDSTATFVTQTPYNPPVRPAAENWLGPYIYKYDLNGEMLPVNRRVFGLVREGIADGIHVDDDGNVWTAESEGIVVRSPKGKVIGVFNAAHFQGEAAAASEIPIANFALAGDTLVIFGVSSLWTVKLGKTVVSANSVIVN
ncbi:calcium-dependent phosphotriesterase [Hortaea werneckii]|nr:calcium-dependent phosphotriesterase [Hortaea werneckii]KAI6999008.1 calcium-dependent phosphotriesterase [Hortaea werneckii]KAI7146758.1 calcium-dependent phosphotriesterase [Hortaea werneckii]KAI7178728.1 calcium-dependent phosphotriesterase [Hortaea werneckii]